MLLWFLVAVPFVVGATLLVARLTRIAAVATAAVTVALSVAAAVTRPAVSVVYLDGISFGLRVDGLSAVMVVTVSVVLLAVLVFATGEPNLDARFYGLMLVFAAAMLVTVTATTLVALLMAWEVMGATSYALIGYWWREPRRVHSGMVAFLTTRAADLGLYLAAGAALAGGAAGLDLARLAGLPDGWRDVVAAGLVVAALGKSAQLPFSFWLSRAMDGPSPVSALLHSATMVAAGAYLLLRMEPLLAATPWAATLVGWAGAATAVLLGAVAVVQRDLKQLLAASTCAQVGFMVLAAGVAGAAAGTAHLVAHAVTKSLLFLCAGAWLTSLGTKNLAELRGAARRHPVVGLTFTAGALALAGIPPLSLWVTKDHVLAAALHDSLPLYLVGLSAAALSAAYAGRALALVWTGPDAAKATLATSSDAVGESARGREGDPRNLPDVAKATLAAPPMSRGRPSRRSTSPRRPSRHARRREGDPRGGGHQRHLPTTSSSVAKATLATWVLVPLAAGAVGLGVLGLWTESAPTWWELVVSGVLAVLVAWVTAGVVRRRGDLPAPGLLLDWLGLEKLARALVARPALALADGLARFDDRAVAGTVRATAAVGTAFARAVDRRVEWSVDEAVRVVARAFRALGRLARRPQTGQLHHYYAQAVVVLIALAVLLLVLGSR